MIIDTRGLSEDQAAKRVADMLCAKSAILGVTKKATKVNGSMACPICHTGMLKYSVAPNGHIWAGCSTKGCVRFME